MNLSTPRTFVLTVLLLLGFAACAPQNNAPADEEGGITPGSTAVEDDSAAPGGTDAEGNEEGPEADIPTMQEGGSLAQRPTAPLRIEGACPFECCTYGTWTTTETTTVYGSPHDTTVTAFTLPAGTAVEAGTGHVLLTQIGAAVAQGEARLYRTYEDYRTIAPGDTVHLLDYVGEGVYHAWYEGEVYEAGPVLPASSAQEGFSGFVETRNPQSQWWAQIETADGRTGWLWMDRTPRMEGVDACGG